MSFRNAILVLTLVSNSILLIECQYDGGFWWLDKTLVESARESRENTNVKAKIINNATEFVANREADDDANNQFVNVNDSPDCTCVPTPRCLKNTKISRDGLCGAGYTCCRKVNIVKDEPTEAPITTLKLEIIKTTVKPIFDNSVVTLFPVRPTSTSTILLPSSAPYKNKKCGHRNLNVNSRILFYDDNDSNEVLGSGQSNFGEFPWTIALFEKSVNGNFGYKCGAVLISTKIVVTACHCIVNFKNNPEFYMVRAGEWNRNHDQEHELHQDRLVSRIVKHPQFYSGTLFNDIAVLQVDVPFDDSIMSIGSICLPNSNDNFYGAKCLVSGWGGIVNQNFEQTVQRFLNMPLVKSHYCESQIQTQSAGRRFKLHDSFLCAGGEIGQDTCKGSGGSPLVCEKHGNYYLAGLVSWGAKCGSGVPGVFVNIPYMSDWIKETVDDLNNANVHYFT